MSVRRKKKMCQQEVKGKETFATKMQDPAFVTAMLLDTGVNRPPCHFCQMHGVCKLSFGDPECKYVLRLESAVDVESEYLAYIAEERRKQSLPQKLMANVRIIPQFVK